jgi:hypothetical protein
MRRLIISAAITFVVSTPLHANDVSDSIDRLNDTLQQQEMNRQIQEDNNRIERQRRQPNCFTDVNGLVFCM